MPERAVARSCLFGVSCLVALLFDGRPAAGQEPTRAAAQKAGPPPGFLADPAWLTRGVGLYDRRAGRDREPADGFFVDFGNMVTGSGWISAGPGYRRHLFRDRAVVTTSAALSWRLYSMAQARIETVRLPIEGLAVGAQLFYQDSLQVNFFGVGSQSSPDDRTGFRLRTADLAAYASLRRGPWVVSVRAGRLLDVDVRRMSGRDPSYPTTQDRFSDGDAPGLAVQPSFLHADATLSVDTRDVARRPSRGGLYSVSGARYADRDRGTYSFRRYEVDAAHYVPMASGRVVLALHGLAMFTDTAPGQVVPFYLMPNLGGKNTLRGFPNYRFYDRHMEMFTVEPRVALFRHMDVAAFVDVGKVAPRASDLGFSDLKSSYGIGVRVHNGRTLIGRVDLAHSRQGWRFVFRVEEPFRRHTYDGDRTSVVPVVP